MTTPTFPIAIDSTMRSAFVSCPHKFYQEFIMGRALEGGSVHLIFGAAYARGLEVARQKIFGEREDVDLAIGLGIVAALVEYGEFEPPPESPKTALRCALAIIEYFHEWDPLTDHIQPLPSSDGKVAVEFKFAIPIPGVNHPETGEPLLYAGRFDMFGKFQDMTLIVDDKTTSSLGASFMNKWKLRGQLTGYVWGAREYGYPVAGAAIRGISILKNSFGTAEVLEMRPDWQVETYLSQLQRDARRMIAHWKEGRWDQVFADACESYGGCMFQRLCTVHNPDEWAEMYYVERRWDPLDSKKQIADTQVITFAT
jgi:hypothetical protein